LAAGQKKLTVWAKTLAFGVALLLCLIAIGSGGGASKAAYASDSQPSGGAAQEPSYGVAIANMVITDPTLYAGFEGISLGSSVTGLVSQSGYIVLLQTGVTGSLQLPLVAIYGFSPSDPPSSMVSADGYCCLTSSTTHQSGLITDTDLADFLAGGSKVSVAAQPADLDQTANLYEQIAGLKPAVGIGFALAALLALLLTAAAWLHRRLRRPGRWPLYLAAGFWLCVLSFIPASLLMFLRLPVWPDALTLLGLALAWTALVVLAACLFTSLVCRFGGWRRRFLYAFAFVLGLTVVVIAGDLVCGGRLSRYGFLTYDIFRSYRYYGIGNELSASLFAAWILFSACVLMLLRKIRHGKGWLYSRIVFPLVSLLLVVICALPGAGASYGPIIWALFGCFWAWWLFCGRRARWFVVVLSVAVPVLLALGVLAADLVFNGGSHMTNLLPAFKQGLVPLIQSTFEQTVGQNLTFVLAYVPWYLLVLFVLVFALFIGLRLRKRGSFGRVWRAASAYAAAVGALLAMAGALLIVEDSGAFACGITLMYAVSWFSMAALGRPARRRLR
jgi:hypothetical protein